MITIVHVHRSFFSYNTILYLSKVNELVTTYFNVIREKDENLYINLPEMKKKKLLVQIFEFYQILFSNNIHSVQIWNVLL